jgi:hypothetical protein
MLTHLSAVACIPAVVDFHLGFCSLLEVISRRTFVGLSTFASISAFAGVPALAVGSIFAVTGISAGGWNQFVPQICCSN